MESLLNRATAAFLWFSGIVIMLCGLKLALILVVAHATFIFTTLCVWIGYRLVVNAVRPS